ncbi:hypothetical protein BC629DRAFT_1597841 [Irpex lacteus]|nr:hypothetical protein BC629DRAFT_1597841 [Irpex lacteus]
MSASENLGVYLDVSLRTSSLPPTATFPQPSPLNCVMMVPPRLPTRFFSGLPFTFPSTIYPVLVFSVACLLVSFLVALFPLCLMASLYIPVAYYHPRMVLFGPLSHILYTLDRFPSALSDPWFLVCYALVLVVARSYVVRYLKKYAMEKVYRPMVLTGWALLEHALLRQEVAFKELVKDEKEITTTAAAAEETQIEDPPVEVQESPEPHNPVLAEQASVAQLSPEETLAGEQVSQDVTSLDGHEQVPVAAVIEEEKQVTESPVEVQESSEPHQGELAEQEHPASLSSEQSRAVEQRPQEDEVKKSEKRDTQVLELTQKNVLLEDRIQSVSNDRDAIAATHKADLSHFAQERSTHSTQLADLQGSLDFINTEHRIHMVHCDHSRTVAAKRSEEQAQELEVARQVHSTELAAVQQAYKVDVSALQARNEVLQERVVEADAARDTIAASYQAHIAHANEQSAVQETQYTALQGSLEFATTEHRIHVAHCEPERTEAKALIEKLTAQLAAERAARAEDQADRNQLKNENARVSAENAALRARLEARERELQLEREQVTPTHTNVSQQSSEATTYVQSESPYFPDSLANTKPPSTPTIFTQNTKPRVLALAQQEFVEGSSQDGLLTPFSAGIIGSGATSTPWAHSHEHHLSQSSDSESQSQSMLTEMHDTSTQSNMDLTHAMGKLQQPEDELPRLVFTEESSLDGFSPFSAGIVGTNSTPWHPHQDRLDAGSSVALSNLSDMDLTGTMDEPQQFDGELSELLRSESTESIYPSPPASGSTSGDMSLASTTERLPHIEIRVSLPFSDTALSYPSPPPSGSTSTLDLEPSLPALPSILLNGSLDISLDDPVRLSPIFPSIRRLPSPPSPGPSFSMPHSDSEPSLPPPPDNSGSLSIDSEDESSVMLCAIATPLTPSFLKPTAPRLQNESSAFSARAKPSFSRPAAPRRRTRAA